LQAVNEGKKNQCRGKETSSQMAVATNITHKLSYEIRVANSQPHAWIREFWWASLWHAYHVSDDAIRDAIRDKKEGDE
jgi:hypothetical protein